MPELSREEIEEKLAEMAGVDVEDVKEYLTCGDDYVESLEDEVKFIDGDEQLDYIYENSDLDPEVIEKIAEAEFELLYGEEE